MVGKILVLQQQHFPKCYRSGRAPRSELARSATPHCLGLLVLLNGAGSCLPYLVRCLLPWICWRKTGVRSPPRPFFMRCYCLVMPRTRRSVWTLCVFCLRLVPECGWLIDFPGFLFVEGVSSAAARCLLSSFPGCCPSPCLLPIPCLLYTSPSPRD